MVGSDEDLGEIALYCGWLACRKVIVQEAGPGRRKEYCSEACRRAADRDYKRAKNHLKLFETQLRNTQHEVAAYGRRADGELLTAEHVERLRATAQQALVRAETVVEFSVETGDRYLEELRRLVEALQPLLESPQVRVSA